MGGRSDERDAQPPDPMVAGPSGSLRAAAVRDPRAPEIGIPAALLTEVYAHAREAYPEECCGLLLAPPGRPPTRIVRCTNVQEARRARGESELDATRAFWIDERELLAALRTADTRGERLAVIYHSHVDADAYLSHADAAGALGPKGQPLYPGTVQLVISVREGRVRDAVGFEWNGAGQRFVGRPIAQAR